MATVDRSDNPRLKIQAFAGTGKSLVLALLVEAALTVDWPRNGAVVIVTPSRDLRDSILQGPDFLGSVFTGDDLGLADRRIRQDRFVLGKTRWRT